MKSLLNKLIVPVLTVTIFLTSCTKVIDINLNDAAPQIVIEGNISNGAGPYQVQISRTINFSDANIFPKVSGALVIISDINSALSDTLIENSPGIYNTKSIKGLVGHSYQLSVLANGNLYTSQSTIPQSVNLDTITFHKTNFFGNFQVNPVVNFMDPSNIINYYSFSLTVNGVKKEDTYLYTDRLADGKTINQEIGLDSLKIGDNVKIEMRCIDKGVYDYYFTLPQVTGNSFQSISPANPLSNISNKALGYFSAHTSQIKEAIVK